MSILPAYDDSNIFRKIVEGTIPSVKVYEDDFTLAIMDVFPQSDGHVLVVHKMAAAAGLLDIDPLDLSELIRSTQMVAKAIEKGLKPDGLRLIQFNGAPAGQTVFHLHFHLIPVYQGVEIKAHASTPAQAEILDPIAAKIRARL